MEEGGYESHWEKSSKIEDVLSREIFKSPKTPITQYRACVEDNVMIVLLCLRFTGICQLISAETRVFCYKSISYCV